MLKLAGLFEKPNYDCPCNILSGYALNFYFIVSFFINVTHQLFLQKLLFFCLRFRTLRYKYSFFLQRSVAMTTQSPHGVFRGLFTFFKMIWHVNNISYLYMRLLVYAISLFYFLWVYFFDTTWYYLLLRWQGYVLPALCYMRK